jgi:hypothetical protein
MLAQQTIFASVVISSVCKIMDEVATRLVLAAAVAAVYYSYASTTLLDPVAVAALRIEEVGVMA